MPRQELGDIAIARENKNHLESAQLGALSWSKRSRPGTPIWRLPPRATAFKQQDPKAGLLLNLGELCQTNRKHSCPKENVTPGIVNLCLSLYFSRLRPKSLSGQPAGHLTRSCCQSWGLCVTRLCFHCSHPGGPRSGSTMPSSVWPSLGARAAECYDWGTLWMNKPTKRERGGKGTGELCPKKWWEHPLCLKVGGIGGRSPARTTTENALVCHLRSHLSYT